MSARAEAKVLQYLQEAHATENSLVRVLQSQVLMAPRGRYRNSLEAHLRETREHARRVRARMQELGYSRDPLQAAVGLAESMVGQALALGKAPVDLLRGSGGEEKVLKNAKDACASEALEIATYAAIERVARDVGDEPTAELAVAIRAEEERMLERLLEEIPTLAGRVVEAAVQGRSSYDVRETGAADAAAEAAHSAASSLHDSEPWPGYDEMNVEEVRGRLRRGAEADLIARVRSYERAHKARAGVLEQVQQDSAASA
jgi:ferritin-like metal-binding protein YciE